MTTELQQAKELLEANGYILESCLQEEDITNVAEDLGITLTDDERDLCKELVKNAVAYFGLEVNLYLAIQSSVTVSLKKEYHSGR